MTDQELVFKTLKRRGECWHRSATGFETSGISFRCLICNKLINRVERPDFSTPSGFFWMWERLQEKGFLEEIFTVNWRYDELEHERMMDWREVATLINPTALYNAVLEWVKDAKNITKEE